MSRSRRPGTPRSSPSRREAVEEIESIRTGAFGSFAENPIVGALLLPGGASLLALVQYLLSPR